MSNITMEALAENYEQVFVSCLFLKLSEALTKGTDTKCMEEMFPEDVREAVERAEVQLTESGIEVPDAHTFQAELCCRLAELWLKGETAPESIAAAVKEQIDGDQLLAGLLGKEA